jgi:hypothetical protein
VSEQEKVHAEQLLDDERSVKTSEQQQIAALDSERRDAAAAHTEATLLLRRHVERLQEKLTGVTAQADVAVAARKQERIDERWVPANILLHFFLLKYVYCSRSLLLSTGCECVFSRQTSQTARECPFSTSFSLSQNHRRPS